MTYIVFRSHQKHRIPPYIYVVAIYKQFSPWLPVQACSWQVGTLARFRSKWWSKHCREEETDTKKKNYEVLAFHANARLQHSQITCHFDWGNRWMKFKNHSGFSSINDFGRICRCEKGEEQSIRGTSEDWNPMCLNQEPRILIKLTNQKLVRSIRW